MTFGPDATAEEIRIFTESHRKRLDDLNNYFTIAFSSDSENRFEEARQAVYGTIVEK